MRTLSRVLIGLGWVASVSVASAGVPVSEEEIATHPHQVEIELPAAGVTRIDVPLELRDPEGRRDGSDLLLVDAAGDAVPFAVVQWSVDEPARVAGRRGAADARGALVWWPDPDGDGSEFLVRIDERPIDALVIQLPKVPSAADVVVWDDQGQELARKRVFRMEPGDDLEVPVPGVLGTLRVDVDLLDRGPLEVPRFDGLRYTDGYPRWTTLDLELQPPAPQENGWVRYDLPLDRPVPMEWLELLADGDLFDRTAEVVERPYQDGHPESLPEDAWSYQGTRVQRIQLGGARLDHTRIPVRAGMSDPILLVSGPPMSIPRVRVHTRALTLVVRDPGSGPFTLYGGGRRAVVRNDLQHAQRELAREASADARLGAVERNPRYTVVPEDLGRPGPPLDDTGFGWSRALQAEGLVRIPLDRHVLTQSRSDMGDLRLIDPAGAQIPYLLRRSGTRGSATDLPVERTEDGAVTRLNVRLPEPNLPVESLTLRSSGATFSRELTVLQPRRSRLVPVRSARWDSAASRDLTLGIARRGGERFVVEIQNRDDPPIAVDGVDVTWANWELVAFVPPGTRLLYGDDDRDAPYYDIVRRGLPLDHAATAPLGEPVEHRPAGPGGLEKLAVWAGIAAVGMGLLALLGLLLRGVPPPEAEAGAGREEEAPTPPEEPPEPRADAAEAG